MSSMITLNQNIERQLLWWAGQQGYIEIAEDREWNNLCSLLPDGTPKAFPINLIRIRLGETTIPLNLVTLENNEQDVELTIEDKHPYYFSLFANGKRIVTFIGELSVYLQPEIKDHLWSELKEEHEFFCRNYLPPSLNENVTSLTIFQCMQNFQLFQLEQCSTIKNVSLYRSHSSGRLPHIPTLEGFLANNCPDLENVSGLESSTFLKHIQLQWCESLQFLPALQSTHLSTLSLQWCNKIEHIFSLQNQTNLQTLDIQACSQLKELPNLDACVHLKDLTLAWFSHELPIPDLQHNVQLETLNLRSFSTLQELPPIQKLQSINHIDISDCNKISSIYLPTLQKLQNLEANGCSSLQRIDISNTTNLKRLSLARATKLLDISGLDVNSSLETLILTGANELITLEGLSNNTNLKHLQINDCFSLTELPNFHRLKHLQSLQVYGCPNLLKLKQLDASHSLSVLQLGGCRSLQTIPNLKYLPDLEELTLSWFHNDVNMLQLSQLKKLKKLKLSGHSKLRNLEGLANLIQLEELDLSRCISLEYLADLDKLTNLKKLILRGCRSLTSLKGLMDLSNLQVIILSYCTSLEELDGLFHKPQLKLLDVSFCRNLHKTPKLHPETLASLVFLNLSNRNHHTDLAKFQKGSLEPRLQEINLENVHNISNLHSLTNFLNLKSIIGLPIAQANYFIAHSALHRKDALFIGRHFDEWVNSLASSNNIDNFIEVLVQAIELTNLGEKAWMQLLSTLRKIERNSQGDSYISENGWHTFFNQLSKQEFSPMGVIIQLLHSQRIDLLQEANAFQGFLKVFQQKQFPQQEIPLLLEQVYIRSSERFKRYYAKERSNWNIIAKQSDNAK
jgi:hypothetical protein